MITGYSLKCFPARPPISTNINRFSWKFSDALDSYNIKFFFATGSVHRNSINLVFSDNFWNTIPNRDQYMTPRKYRSAAEALFYLPEINQINPIYCSRTKTYLTHWKVACRGLLLFTRHLFVLVSVNGFLWAFGKNCCIVLFQMIHYNCLFWSRLGSVVVFSGTGRALCILYIQ